MVKDKQKPAVIHREADADLRNFVEESLRQHAATSGSLRALTCAPSPFGTLFQVEILTVQLDTGEELKLFLKHLGTEQADHPDKQCRDREPRIYRELQKHDDLPAVRCYGIRQNQTSSCYEILLEYIADWNLKYQAMDCWFEAARKLAYLHGRLVHDAAVLAEHDWLLHLNTGYRRAWAERAIGVVAEYSVPLAAEFRNVVESYGLLDDLLDGWPQTLVHNDLSPKNVIADRSHGVPRICFVDWEMAGVGCGVIDLAHLAHGLGGDDERKMCESYLKELQRVTRSPVSPTQWERLFAASQLHNTVYRLAHARIWQLSLDRVAEWVHDTQRFLTQAANGR